MLSFKECFYQLKPGERFCDIYTLPSVQAPERRVWPPWTPATEVVVLKEEGSESITRARPSGTKLHKCWVNMLGLSQVKSDLLDLMKWTGLSHCLQEFPQFYLERMCVCV